MPVLETILAAVAAFSSSSDVILSVFSLCMQGYCRSSCLCAELEHDSTSSPPSPLPARRSRTPPLAGPPLPEAWALPSTLPDSLVVALEKDMRE